MLKFAGIEGESVQEGYSNWIECHSLSGGNSVPISVDANQGLGSGRVNVLPYSLTLHTGAHTNELMQKMQNGKHHDTVDIHILKQTGDASGKPYWTWKGTKCYVEHLGINATGDGDLYENLVLHAEEHQHEYFKQDDAGSLTSTGAKTYNQKENKTS